MLITAALTPDSLRFLPRARPGTGPTSRREAAVQAEVTMLAARVVAIERELQVQLERIAQIQRQLDDMSKLLRELARK